MTSHKTRMLNAYRGIYSDFYPVAPEFWYYYPAKVMGVDMIEFNEIPHWKAMRATALKFDAETWCVIGANSHNPRVAGGEHEVKKIGEGRYRNKYITRYDNGLVLESTYISDVREPGWRETYPAKSEEDLMPLMDVQLSDDISYDFKNAKEAWREVGDDLLLEFSLGETFFDYVCGAMGFEKAVLFFYAGHDRVLEEWREKFMAQRMRLLRETAAQTEYEAVFIGCGCACNALLGPPLWRKWDKPYLKAITAEAHKLGLLVHNHNHGKIMETVPDLAEIGFDCVCPFEREPGDVVGLEGLKKVRDLLEDKVTFNGNVATVATLINGKPEDVRREVREIKEAFAGTPRLIIGTGDQVGGETPEENLYAMIDEGRK